MNLASDPGSLPLNQGLQMARERAQLFARARHLVADFFAGNNQPAQYPTFDRKNRQPRQIVPTTTQLIPRLDENIINHQA